MYLYPSEGWLDEYTRLLDESDALDDLSSGVGLVEQPRVLVQPPLGGIEVHDWC